MYSKGGEIIKQLKEIISDYFNIISSIIIIIMLCAIIFIILTKKSDKLDNKQIIKNEITDNFNEEQIVSKNKIKVDIKGAIKKEGVYELDANSTVDDLIKLAGGLKKNATTTNINLSKILENQMVVRIFTNTEYKKRIKNDSTEIVPCICSDIDITNCKDSTITKIEGSNNDIEPTKSNNIQNELEPDSLVKISINTATKEELMTLPGIGESKAISIIEYRNVNSFATIEDIKNVSGIGDALFEKIKEYISI